MAWHARGQGFKWTEPRVRAHLVLCLLAGYLTWHLRHALAPITFTDTDRPGPDRPDPVAAAQPSPSAKAKAAHKQAPDGQPGAAPRLGRPQLPPLVCPVVEPSSRAARVDPGALEFGGLLAGKPATCPPAASTTVLASC
jgi:hypothetical protein